ncbi:DGF-1-like protein, putative [Bodo saltans]|uniref:DGF-1-like protein, putative n=1 Tax=Bodo saltans TaxID=75058 RepID=A0A0S4IZV3_BODSA|nr:DGF-1-like protein, putative [Bodo saltans]|eukprot:CUG36377.1 DGF-1-like protein, putative [Bodo saltans]
MCENHSHAQGQRTLLILSLAILHVSLADYCIPATTWGSPCCTQLEICMPSNVISPLAFDVPCFCSADTQNMTTIVLSNIMDATIAVAISSATQIDIVNTEYVTVVINSVQSSETIINASSSKNLTVQAHELRLRSVSIIECALSQMILFSHSIGNATTAQNVSIDIDNSSTSVSFWGDFTDVSCFIVNSAHVDLSFIGANRTNAIQISIATSSDVSVAMSAYQNVTAFLANCADVEIKSSSCAFVNVSAQYLTTNRTLVTQVDGAAGNFFVNILSSLIRASWILWLKNATDTTVLLTSVDSSSILIFVLFDDTIRVAAVTAVLKNCTLKSESTNMNLVVGSCKLLAIHNSALQCTSSQALLASESIMTLNVSNSWIVNYTIRAGKLANLTVVDSTLQQVFQDAVIFYLQQPSLIMISIVHSTLAVRGSVLISGNLAIANVKIVHSSIACEGQSINPSVAACGYRSGSLVLSLHNSTTYNCSLVSASSTMLSNITVLLNSSSLRSAINAPSLISLNGLGHLLIVMDHVRSTAASIFQSTNNAINGKIQLRSAKLPYAYLPESATTIFEDCESVVRSPHTKQPVAVKWRLQIDQVKNNSNQKIEFNDSLCMLTPSVTVQTTASMHSHQRRTVSISLFSASRSISLPVLIAPTGDAPLPAQIGSNVATAASLVTGSDTSNIVMMSMLSLLSCEGRPSALGTTTNTVSLFFTLGGWQMAVGNLGLVLAILIAHVTATSFLSWRRGTSFPTECHGVVRFPSMSITASEFLLPGSTYGAVMVLTNTDSDAGELAACIMCIVVIVGTIVVRQAFLVHNVLPHTQWELYLHRPVDVWDAKLYPIGRWSPKGMRNSFGSLIGPMKRRFASYRVVESILALLIAAAAGAGGQSGEYVCRSLVYLVGILCAVVALLCALTRPYRFPMDRYTTPLVHLLFSVVCFLKASKANAVIVSWIQVVQSVVLVWKNVWMVSISLREAMWEDEADANDEDKEEGGGGIIRTIVAALWFGGGGLGTSRKNVQFTRFAQTEEEELADWLPDDVLQRDVPGMNIGDELMAPLVQGPANVLPESQQSKCSDRIVDSGGAVCSACVEECVDGVDLPREAMWEDEADANDEDKEEGGGGIIRTIVAALWFGGGGLGTSRKNVQFTRFAQTEEEELADWLPDDVLQRDVPGMNIGDELMAPLVQGPANDEDMFQPKDTVDLMSCSNHSSEEDAPPPIAHEDGVDVEGVIELRVEDKPPVVNNTAKTDFFVGIEGYYMN